MGWRKKIIFYFAAAILIIYGQFFYNPDLLKGKVPDFSASTLNGKIVSRKDLEQKRILYFWADWCGVCRRMQPTIDEILSEYPGITIAVRSDDPLKAIKHSGSDWITLNDAQGKLAEQFGITGVPTLFFLDKEGQIRFSSVGYTTAVGIRVKLWLAGL